jgi:hypothetical protein
MALAHAVLAEALLAQAKIGDAQRESAISRKLAAATQQRQVQWRAQLVAARADAAAGNLSPAIAALEEIEHQLKNLGLTRHHFDVQLALGEIELKAGNSESGRRRLQGIEREARARAFARVAAKAKRAAS